MTSLSLFEKLSVLFNSTWFQSWIVNTFFFSTFYKGTVIFLRCEIWNLFWICVSRNYFCCFQFTNSLEAFCCGLTTNFKGKWLIYIYKIFIEAVCFTSTICKTFFFNLFFFRYIVWIKNNRPHKNCKQTFFLFIIWTYTCCRYCFP